MARPSALASSSLASIVRQLPGASGDFQATYGVTSDGELRTAELTGAFYRGKPGLTYALTLEDYGTSKDITAP